MDNEIYNLILAKLNKIEQTGETNSKDIGEIKGLLLKTDNEMTHLNARVTKLEKTVDYVVKTVFTLIIGAVLSLILISK